MTKYGNWMPKWLLNITISGLILLYALSIFFIYKQLIIISIIFILISIISTVFTIKFIQMYKAFDYNNKNSLSWRIINYVASFVKVKPNQKILDIGCGSGALTIQCAKNNKTAALVGIDRWGKEYSEFSKTVCENNAEEEMVNNIIFKKGDVTSLDLEKESFDCITSNYVIHNVPENRQEILLNILNLLKKGGTFAIHDIFSEQKYGDMMNLITRLKNSGYKEVKLIETATGNPMTRKEAKRVMLSDSKLFYGIK